MELLVSSMLGEGFGVAAESPSISAEALLYPEETTALSGARRKRRIEFATVRSCARNAMARLGLSPGAIPKGAGGAPQWPTGMLGSLSHTEGLCLAAVTRAGQALAVGVDAEADAPLDSTLEDLVCTPGERGWIDALEPAARGSCAKLVFSAKEAFYKAQYVLTKRFLDFQEVELAFDVLEGSFRVVAAPVFSPAFLLTQVRGRFGRIDGWLLTTVVIGGGPTGPGAIKTTTEVQAMAGTNTVSSDLDICQRT